MTLNIFTTKLSDGNDYEFASITREDGSQQVMLKSTYDEQQAQQVEHLTEIPTV